MNDFCCETSVATCVTLAAIMRNEASCLLEWVAYHRAIGFDKIIVYDNESTDNTADLCCRLAAGGVIGYKYWPDPPPNDPIGPQVLAYEDVAATAQTDWLCFLDADEFLTLENYSSVKEMIARAGVAGMPIALNWKIFGSSGCVEASGELVTDRFIRCATSEHAANGHIKTVGPTSILRQGARVHTHAWVLVDPGHFYVDAFGAGVKVEGCTYSSTAAMERGVGEPLHREVS